MSSAASKKAWVTRKANAGKGKYSYLSESMKQHNQRIAKRDAKIKGVSKRSNPGLARLQAEFMKASGLPLKK